MGGGSCSLGNKAGLELQVFALALDVIVSSLWGSSVLGLPVE